MTATAATPHAASALSLDAIRASFPALARMHGGHHVGYFDGPGGTQVPASVVDAMRDYLLHHNSNSHWSYPTSVETDVIIDEARAAAADFLNAAPNEVVFGANMTTLTFALSRALARTMSEGDEIIVTELDHHANIAPWVRLVAERGVIIKTAKMDLATGTLDWASLEAQFGACTKLLAIGGSSNALGTINDIARATALAHSHGARVFIDAVAYAPHALMDVRAVDCEFLACSAYKFYGPHAGLLYGKHALLSELDVAKLAPAPAQAPDRWETGTLNFESMAGSTAAIDFLSSLGANGNTGESRRERLVRAYDSMHERITPLFANLWNGLAAIRGVKLYGPVPSDAPRAPTIAFTVAGVDSREVATRLANEFGIFAPNGHFYAATIAERYNVSGSGWIRAGCACYTTAEEIERLVSGVRAISRAS